MARWNGSGGSLPWKKITDPETITGITSERIDADAKSGFIGKGFYRYRTAHLRQCLPTTAGSVHVYMIEQRRQPGDGIPGYLRTCLRIRIRLYPFLSGIGFSIFLSATNNAAKKRPGLFYFIESAILLLPLSLPYTYGSGLPDPTGGHRSTFV